jgi:hypothetical protein
VAQSGAPTPAVFSARDYARSRIETLCAGGGR